MYRNTNLENALREAQKVQKPGVYIASSPAQYGLGSSLDWQIERDYSSYSNRWRCPYGVAQQINTGIYYLEWWAVTARPGAKIPENLLDDRPIVIAHAIVHVATKIAEIVGKTKDGEEWSVQFSDVDISKEEADLMNEFNNSLHSTGNRIAVVSVNKDGDPREFQKTMVPTMVTGNVITPVTGYAIDPIGRGVVFLSFAVSNKQLGESVHATLFQQKNLDISNSPMGNYGYCHGMNEGKYRKDVNVVSNPKLYCFAETCGLAIPSHWTTSNDVIYALYFEGTNANPMDILFSRIAQVIPGAILPEWRDVIVGDAKKSNLVRDIDTWGTCEQGWAIDCDSDRWTELVNGELKSHKLILK